MNAPYSSQRGFVRLSAVFMKDMTPFNFACLFQDCVVIAIEHEPWQDCAKYYFRHAHLRPIARGEITPEYKAEFHPKSQYPFWVETK